MNKSKLLPLITAIIFSFTGCKDSQNTIQPQAETPAYSITTETITEKIPSDDDPVYTISYTYPVITTTAKDDKTISEALKKEASDYVNAKKTSDDVKNAKNIYELAKSAGKEFYTHSSTVNYIMQYNKNNIVSFLKAHEDYTGGTNRIHYSEGITFNLETGNKYELSDIFGATDQTLKKILVNGFKTEAADNKEIFKDKTDFTEDDINKNMSNLNWYLSPDGIVFFFNPNTIIPGANEILQFTYAYTGGNKLMFKENLFSKEPSVKPD